MTWSVTINKKKQILTGIKASLFFQSRQHRGSVGACTPPPPPPTFLRTKKKVRKRKKERVSKQKLLKGCHQDQNITVLAILERLEFENFSCWPTIVADSTFQCSMTSPL